MNGGRQFPFATKSTYIGTGADLTGSGASLQSLARRDVLIDGLGQSGPGQWKIEKPLATMFVWAPVPEPFRAMGSLEFSKRMLADAKVAVAPGIGFGETGEGFVRFALVENRHRIRQAVRGIRRFLRSAAP